MAAKYIYFIAIIHIIICLELAHGVARPKKCVTGLMTDVQNWVSEDGNVIIRDASQWGFIADVSKESNPVPKLKREIGRKRDHTKKLTILNMAKCNLTAIPHIFNFTDYFGTRLAESMMVATFFGNHFDDFGNAPNMKNSNFGNGSGKKGGSFSTTGSSVSTWSLGFKNVIFTKLKELDLRDCSIRTLNDNIFSGMPVLEALYLSGNQICYVSNDAFHGLDILTHLDLSYNGNNNGDGEVELNFQTDNVLKSLNNLVSLDLSHTKIAAKRVGILQLGRSLERLSICYSGVRLFPKIFEGTSLKILDISGNPAVLTWFRILEGLEDKLEILYAANIGMSQTNTLTGFKQLRMLNLNSNDIAGFTEDVTSTWENLRVLLLNNNRISTWFEETFSSINNLSLLSLKRNNINVIKPSMLQDIHDIEYLAMSDNFFVCNCYAREFIEISEKNWEEGKTYSLEIDGIFNDEQILGVSGTQLYHTGAELLSRIFKQFNSQEKVIDIDNDKPSMYSGNFILVDYNSTAYECLSAQDGRREPFSTLERCDLRKDINYDTVIEEGWNRLLLLIIPGLTIILVALGYYYRWNFKYFWITIKNSFILSLIESKEVNEDTVYTYDVFVSYCNDDRAWVLDELLPQLEKSCNVSVCLHERDFQVGLSILENIVSCMDRSKAIMLIISQKFLLSQWCQFEMHLAQHRLLETRREDLILILLEEVPRRLRPNTLHYLMLTKTYVQWPKEQAEMTFFWRRLKRSVVMQKNKRIVNSSLA